MKMQDSSLYYFRLALYRAKKTGIQFLEERNQFRTFFRDYSIIKEKNDGRFRIDDDLLKPCLFNKSPNLGFNKHYTYHPAWAARVISKLKIKKHVDISSILDFGTIVSAFIDVDYYEFKPPLIKGLSNYKAGKVDLVDLPFEDQSIESLSCMHTIEHVGLGRYGDPIDVRGDLKAFSELKRVVARNGHLIIVVPVGKPVIMFNAHRLYSYEMIMDIFNNEFNLQEFALVYDNGDFIVDAPPEDVKYQNYGCGCFYFCKKP